MPVQMIELEEVQMIEASDEVLEATTLVARKGATLPYTNHLAGVNCAC